MANPMKEAVRQFAKHIAFETSLRRPAILDRTQFGPFNMDDVRWLTAAVESARFIDREMPLAKACPNKYELIDLAMHERIDGHILEFGVASGDTLRHIGSVSGSVVHGFDSFEGLPEDWTREVSKGAFAQPIPDVGAFAKLWHGWFQDTVPEFIASETARDGRPASFIHIDCDLYSSTRTVLEGLMPLIRPGTRLVFDEYFNYPGWRQHEHKAFREFRSDHGVDVRWLGYVPAHQQAAVEVTAIGF